MSVLVQNLSIKFQEKGAHFSNTHLGIDIITPKDKKDILWGIQNGVDFMAISFVQSAQDMKIARKIIQDNKL
ncbi:MAG: pyruvate kinase [Sulfurimonas sp.]|nr:pyruvate kinase [Sulfurimonas sp.]